MKSLFSRNRNGRFSRRKVTAALFCTVAVSAPFASNAAPIAGRGTWETTLQARDINGDGVVDAYYDTSRNVTWLADAKAIRGTVFDDGYRLADGEATYASGQAWLDGLNVYGVTGWGYPGDNIANLYRSVLGNNTRGYTPTSGWVNTGPFLNVGGVNESHWTWVGLGEPIRYQGGTSEPTLSFYISDATIAFTSTESVRRLSLLESSYNVWALKSGDVPVATSVPEPSTWACMALGLAGLTVTARRHTKSS